MECAEGCPYPAEGGVCRGSRGEKFFVCQVMEGVLTPTNSLRNTTLTESVIS